MYIAKNLKKYTHILIVNFYFMYLFFDYMRKLVIRQITVLSSFLSG
jgi:hypothetical protein